MLAVAVLNPKALVDGGGESMIFLIVDYPLQSGVELWG